MISATLQRDQVCDLAKRDSSKALEKARSIPDPWFRSQVLAWVARYSEAESLKIVKEAVKAANECNDESKKTAVRAWEIAALAERKFLDEVKKGLQAALNQSTSITPHSSRAEALMLILQAAILISVKDANEVADELNQSCGQDAHWRCKRAVRDAGQLIHGQLKPRPLFW